MKTTQYQVFEADCIEHGERFITIFKTTETDLDKVYLYGKHIASGWGAECISIAPTTDYTDINDVYDFDVKEAKSKAYFDEQYIRHQELEKQMAKQHSNKEDK